METATIFLLISILLNAFLLAGFVYPYHFTDTRNPGLLWTPFQSSLEYHVQVFQTGLSTEVTPYQGPPGDETDKLWDDLYVEAFVITHDEAARQPNKTVTYTADPESGYVTSFSVMHYLHCLNMIRKMTDFIYFPEYWNVTKNHNPFTDGLDAWPHFGPFGMWSREHISHCIDSVRQALMCQPDLGPVVWQWVPAKGKVQVWAETAHTCANYNEVLRFAKDRQVSVDGGVPDKNVEREGVGQCGGFDSDCRLAPQ